MIPELDVYRDHMERYRAVTLQTLDLVDDGDLAWRPGPDHYTLGQILLHIAQTEDFQMHRLVDGEADMDKVRFPKKMPGVDELRAFYEEVRGRTLATLEEVTAEELDGLIPAGEDEPELTLRSWLWFILEHEVHHKGQIATYLRQMGITPPFFATPLPDGQRPDMEFRENLGGF